METSEDQDAHPEPEATQEPGALDGEGVTDGDDSQSEDAGQVQDQGENRTDDGARPTARAPMLADGGRLPRLMLGLALIMAGAAVALVSISILPSQPKVVGGNVPINEGARTKLDVTAHNSPSVTTNPTNTANVVVVNRIDNPGFHCGIHVSFDGGATWAPSTLPQAAPDKIVPCFSPDATFDAAGKLYVSFTTFGQVPGKGVNPDQVWLATSTDGGRNLSPPVPAAGPMAFQVRLAADAGKAGRLYLSWVQVDTTGNFGFTSDGNPILASRTDDGGATWSPPVTVNNPARRRVVAPSLAVGNDNELYAAYLDVGDDSLDYLGAHEGKGGEPYPGRWSLVVSRSADAGATWTESAVDDQVAPFQRFLQLFPPSPSLALHRPSGRVYLAFHDSRGGDADVLLWSSRDQGRTWSPPRRVNDSDPGDQTAQYLPKLGVAPNGRLDVLYYDRRDDRENVMNEVSLQFSDDGGRTFSPRLELSQRAFDSRIGFGNDRGMPDLGSRLGLLSTPDGALAVWADSRSGEAATGKQDLARAVVSISKASPLRLPLRWVSLLIALTGAVLITVTLIGAVRPRGPRSERPTDEIPDDMTTDGDDPPAEREISGAEDQPSAPSRESLDISD